MTAPEAVPYGGWPSPITARSVVEGTVGVGEVVVDEADAAVWWAESLPSQGGRVRLVRRARGGEAREATPPDANVRTRVHTYGGGAWWVAGGVCVYCDDADRQLRRLDVDTGAVTVLTDTPRHRYADGRPVGDRYVCVRERHDTDGEAVNDIVAVALDGSGVVTRLVGGADFYAEPRPSPDGGRLAWLQWNHPDMPWDGTEVWVGDLDAAGAAVGGARWVAGGPDEWIATPVWLDADRLGWVSDARGWSRIVRVDVAADGAVPSTWVDLDGAEIPLPPWVFGRTRWGTLGDGTLVHASTRPAGDVVTVGSTSSDVDTSVATLCTGTDRVVLAGASFDRPTEIVEIDAAGGRRVLASPNAASVAGIEPGFLTAPEPFAFATDHGETAHALLYRPANPRVRAPAGEAPPALVVAHGGPTAAARRELQLSLRYWTSRGWAVVDVDYRGSTGYGRAYRNALRGRWGEADVVDLAAAARHLGERGDIDPRRVVSRGSSAGALTVLGALLAAPDVFAAGAVRYPVADLELLATDTHKFEARLLDRMVGPHPQAVGLYRERSPIHHLDRLERPMLVMQGSEDEVTPPSQAETLVATLAAKGIRHAYLVFEGEAHGFRRAETIIRALEAEHAFFAAILGLRPDDDLAPLPVA